jgi:DNA polymerase/3'-5' exonuclease PolX
MYIRMDPANHAAGKLSAEAQMVAKYNLKPVPRDQLAALITCLNQGQAEPEPWIGAGSYRREKPFPRDFDLLFRGSWSRAQELLHRHSAAGLCFTIMDEVKNGPIQGSFVAKLPTGTYVKIDVFCISNPAAEPYAMLHHTGSREFNMRVRAVAKTRGYKLNQYGLFYADGKNKDKPIDKRLTTEREVLEFLGVTWLEPRDRD